MNLKKLKRNKRYIREDFLSFRSSKSVLKLHKENNNYNAAISLNFNCKKNQLLTYAQIDKEKEVLFFPFSSFKIISINKKQNESNEKEYYIAVEYLDTVIKKPKIESSKIKGGVPRIEFHSLVHHSLEGKKTKTLIFIIISIFVLFICIFIYFYKNK